MADMGYFVPHYFHAIDMGVPRIIGVQAIYTYDVLRRYVCRDDRRAGNLSRFYREGHLVCSLSQANVAEIIGLKQRQTASLFSTLKRHGWIRTLGSVASNSSVLVYHLGEMISADGERGRSGTAEVFFADDWITKARRALTKHARKATGDPDAEYRDLPFSERFAFVQRWAEEEAPRTGVEDANPATRTR